MRHMGNKVVLRESRSISLIYNNEPASRADVFQKYLDVRFKVSERGSTIQTEIKAGLMLYATMCYIIIVNPEVLAVAGIDKDVSASATALCGMAATLLFGFVANLPFGSAPGMGLNTLFAYEMVRQNHLTPQQVLASCFVAGTVFLVLGMSGAATPMVSQIPLSLKKAVVVSIGLLQTIVGMAAMHMIQPGTSTILEAAPITNYTQWLGLFTLALMGLLILLEIPGSILIGIVTSTLLSLSLNLVPLPGTAFSMPSLKIANFDFSVFSTPKGWFLTFLVFLVLFIDVGGVVMGVSAQGDTLLDENGECISSSKAYVCVGIGVLISSFFGTSPVVIFLESAAAVSQGGRTGIVAIVAAMLLGISSFFVPLVGMVPPSSTYPVLILVGSFMMGAVLVIRWDKINYALPAFLTITITAFTCSISRGVVYGCTLYAILNFPFWFANATGWQWLSDTLGYDNEEQSVQSKTSTHAMRYDRNTGSMFSAHHESTTVSSEEKSPTSRVSTGWL